ncbi:hypothetical protein [Bowmanella pacifica]|uniref:Uncharacterized protein n=1 Tax=Bowmanella pacifica TaxID=502051 RepID=A0A917YS32_9ALTE|nr:hypothetical protein [Bowmanella pacifica]GGO64997.1 hypothetical protein GCM10010982_05750 [Bowmanella pacifica]
MDNEEGKPSSTIVPSALAFINVLVLYDTQSFARQLLFFARTNQSNQKKYARRIPNNISPEHY